MFALRLSALALLVLQILPASIQAIAPEAAIDNEALETSPNLAVKISTSFPQSEIFGVKLVNGHPTQALVSFQNEETAPISVTFIGGTLWAPDPATQGKTDRVIRNITTTRYNVQVPAGESESISYSFATELHPQDLRLHLVAMVQSDKGAIYTFNFFNETVSVVEPDASFFDPQLIFLYLLLLGMLGGSCYFIYNQWIATLFPQKARGGKGGDRAKRSSAGSKKVDPADQMSVVGADGPAVTTGAKAYDESWIPAHHINRPESKRLKSGGGTSGKSKNKGKTE